MFEENKMNCFCFVCATKDNNNEAMIMEYTILI